MPDARQSLRRSPGVDAPLVVAQLVRQCLSGARYRI